MSRSTTSLSIVLAVALAALPAAADEGPIAVVEAAYVDGIHRNADASAMRAGFHESFVMFVNGEEDVGTVTREEWASRLEKAGADPERETPDISAELEVIGESGKAAVVKVELSRDGEHVFTDFLSLYETPEGWKIVGKIFERHP